MVVVAVVLVFVFTFNSSTLRRISRNSFDSSLECPETFNLLFVILAVVVVACIVFVAVFDIVFILVLVSSLNIVLLSCCRRRRFVGNWQ